MKNDEFNYYNKIKNWDFSQINCEVEVFTNWDINKILNERATINSRILDLGTGGGEIVINEFPEALEIVGTDFSPEMIKTAKENLKKSKKKNIKFRIMDNLNMDTEDNYFDIVVARNTCINAKQIYKTLKYEREYYKTKEDLLALLLKTPILNDFTEEHENNNIDMQILNKYIESNTTNKGILLRRRYYGIIANK